jgi:uncharacterized protein YcnI
MFQLFGMTFLVGMGALVAAVLGLLGHVSVMPRRSPAGAHDRFSFRVPTEGSSPTVKLRVEVPAGVKVTSFQSKAGWDREVEHEADGRVAAITWSGGSIPMTEFEEFGFVAITPQEPCELRWLAYQTYEDGGSTVFGDLPGAERAPVSKVVNDPNL